MIDAHIIRATSEYHSVIWEYLGSIIRSGNIRVNDLSEGLVIKPDLKQCIQIASSSEILNCIRILRR